MGQWRRIESPYKCALLQVIDLMVRLLQCPLQTAVDQTHLTRVFKGAYDVLYTYMVGNSRKNSLYFAKYIDFFQTQIIVKVVRLGNANKLN